MLKNVFAVIALAAAATVAATGTAVAQLPQASPAASVSQTIGVTDVAVTYHRPGVKGRAIWGALVPYGQVWRVGANEATTIRFSDAVKVEGHDVPAGTYALFATPQKDKWTFILDKKPDQWGAYSHKDSDNLLTFDVVPAAAPATEWMEISIAPTGPSSGEVAVQWEKLRAAFKVEVNVSASVWAKIDAAIAAAKPGDAAPYRNAARWALQDGKRLDEAMTWIDKALSMQETAGGLDTKAELLNKAGKKAEAVATLQKAIAKAKATQGSEEVAGELEKKLAEWSKK